MSSTTATAAAAALSAAGPSASPDPCPACDSVEYKVLLTAEDRRFRTTAEKSQVVECGACRLIRMEPRPTPEEVRKYYPVPDLTPAVKAPELSVRALCERLSLISQLRFTERALRDSCETGLVLDVGCGDGRFLDALRRRGTGNVAGLDFSLSFAADAWRMHGVPAVCATLSRAPFAPGSCAAITMFHVLQHLYHPVAYLDAARELLAPEGRLIVQVPNARSWQFLVMGSHWNGLDVPRQLVLFKADDLAKLLEECGFEVLRRQHFSLRDNPALLVSSIFPDLDPAARRARRVAESRRLRFWKNAAYYALFMLAVPVTWFEAACHAGATVMFEARKR